MTPNKRDSQSDAITTLPMEPRPPRPHRRSRHYLKATRRQGDHSMQPAQQRQPETFHDSYACHCALSAEARGAYTRVAERRSRGNPDFKFFHRVVELLPQVLPAKLPVVVRLGSPGPYTEGICRRFKSQFRICVSWRLCEDVAIDVLIHEWAHALAWPRRADLSRSLLLPPMQRQQSFHGPEWGRAYAKVYCAVVLDICPRVRREQQAARRKKQRTHRN